MRAHEIIVKQQSASELFVVPGVGGGGGIHQKYSNIAMCRLKRYIVFEVLSLLVGYLNHRCCSKLELPVTLNNVHAQEIITY